MRLLWAINHGLNKASRRLQSRFGVTGQQRLVIRIVGSFPRLSAGEVARTLHVHPSTLTGILQRLERRGLLRRRTDPSDARRVQLELTAKGRRLMVPTFGTIEASVKRTLAAFPDGDVAATRRVLGALRQALDIGTIGDLRFEHQGRHWPRRA